MTAFYNLIIQYKLFNLIFIPLLIFFAKILEVSLATLGLIFTSKGYKKLATIMSFIEICIYLFAITKIIENLTNFYYYFAYAGGYALGTYFGIWIEEKISIGYSHIRIITRKNAEQLVKKIQFEGYKTTKYIAKSTAAKKVEVINTVVKRKDVNKISDMIYAFDKKAFYSTEDIRQVSG